MGRIKFVHLIARNVPVFIQSRFFRTLYRSVANSIVVPTALAP